MTVEKQRAATLKILAAEIESHFQNGSRWLGEDADGVPLDDAARRRRERVVRTEIRSLRRRAAYLETP